MLTSKQIKSLPKGNYPNWRLAQLFPKQQGDGHSAKFITEKTQAKEGNPESWVTKLINTFTGKEIKTKQKVMKSNKKD